jgi:hypothetical protein
MAKPSPHYAYDPCLLSLGASIRSLRLRRGLSQEQLAHEANIDRSYMGGIELTGGSCALRTGLG